VHADYAKILGELVGAPATAVGVSAHPCTLLLDGGANRMGQRFRVPLGRRFGRLVPTLVRHGIENLHCTDVLKYLGKKRPQWCGNEAKIDLRERPEGTRLQFWYGTNSLKMYDKEKDRVFAPETTINQPKEFMVFRKTAKAAADEAPQWRPMRKGVADMERRAEVSQAATIAYWTVWPPWRKRHAGEFAQALGQASHPQRQAPRPPLNPLTGKDGELLRILARGDFLLKGFRQCGCA